MTFLTDSELHRGGGGSCSSAEIPDKMNRTDAFMLFE